MAVNATTATNTGQGLGTSVGSATQLTMDFLKLLTVQLANQDPLSPMDNQAMVEQLAADGDGSQLHRAEGDTHCDRNPQRPERPHHHHR